MKNIFKMLKNNKGLSLIEILVVMTIIGMMALVAVPSYKIIIEKAKVRITGIELGNIETSLSMYLEENSKYPDNLNELINSKMIKGNGDKIFKDEWGKDYNYSPKMNNQEFELYSSGKDGIMNTDDDISRSGTR